jgi:hypothetical protein
MTNDNAISSIIFFRERSPMAECESSDQLSLFNEHIAVFIQHKVTKNRNHEDF